MISANQDGLVLMYFNETKKPKSTNLQCLYSFTMYMDIVITISMYTILHTNG